MTRTALVVALTIALLAACTDRTGASVQTQAPNIADGVEGCVELNQRGEPTDARLVQLGLEGSKRDGRPTIFHKAVPSAGWRTPFLCVPGLLAMDRFIIRAL